MSRQTQAQLTARRGELMAELFLQNLGPRFVAKATVSDFLFDFLAGFPNPEGGINTFAVEVKSTERPISGTFILNSKTYKMLSNSNIPVLLLVVDVKQNELYYAWPSDHPDVSQLGDSVRVPVIKINDIERENLITRMAG